MSDPAPGAPTPTKPTPLPEVDEAAVARYWQQVVADLDLDADPLEPPAAEFFGDGVELADELAALVVHGPKRATAGAWIEYEAEGQPLPRVDGHWIVLGGDGRPACTCRTTWVRVGPLSSVDEAFAHDEGEGDRTRDWWIEAHRRFFSRALPAFGLQYEPDLDVVFERFALVHVAGEGPVDEPRASRGSDAA